MQWKHSSTAIACIRSCLVLRAKSTTLTADSKNKSRELLDTSENLGTRGRQWTKESTVSFLASDLKEMKI